MKGFWIFIFIFFMNFCYQWKSEINSQDVQKVLDRLAYTRFIQRLELEDLNAIQSDKELFLEICEIYRISPSAFLSKLKESNPKLYKHLGKEYEN